MMAAKSVAGFVLLAATVLLRYAAGLENATRSYYADSATTGITVLSISTSAELMVCVMQN